MNVFVKELYERLHPLGMLVTQDVMPNDEDFNVKELAKYEDYIFSWLMSQHWDESVPGPVSDQKWIEKITDEIARKYPHLKLSWQ